MEGKNARTTPKYGSNAMNVAGGVWCGRDAWRVGLLRSLMTGSGTMDRCVRHRRVPPLRSDYAGLWFPPKALMVVVRCYLRYGLYCRDVKGLYAERSIEVDHVTVPRWVQQFMLLLIDAARPCRCGPGDRWFAEEFYVKIAGRWVSLLQRD